MRIKIVTRGVWLLIASCFLCTAAFAQDTLRIGLSSTPLPFDPAVATSAEQAAVAFAAYENLVTRNRMAGVPEFLPERASRWHVSEDGLVWTFEIAEGGRFSSGTPVDAAAVKYSIDRLIAIGRGPSSDASGVIERVDVSSATQVRIYLKRPTPRFLAIVAERAMSIIDPDVKRYEEGGDEGAGWLASHTAGSGPYQIREGSIGGVFVMERNPHYADAPAFDRIIFRQIQDPISRSMGIMSDEIDIAVLMPAQTLRRAKSRDDVDIVVTPTYAFQNLAFNLDRDAFSDRRLREAVGLAIDTNAIVTHVREGYAGVMTGPLPGSDVNKGAEPHGLFDMEKAKALAQEVLGDERLTISMIYPGVSPETDTVAQYLQAQMAELGIRVRLERLSIAAYVDRLNRGAYDLVLMGQVARDTDPMAILGPIFDSSRSRFENASGFKNQEVDQLIQAAQTEGDAEKRTALVNDIVNLTQKSIPYIHLQQTHIAFLIRSDITGFRFDPINVLDLPYQELGRSE